MADSFIMSKSSFSWTAAVLSNSSHIYYTPDYHHQKPLKYWYINYEDKSFIALTDTNTEWIWWNENGCSVTDTNLGGTIAYKWSCADYLCKQSNCSLISFLNS